MELNAKQVKKWLEICAEDTPYPDQERALLDALALINSQEQRIKELAEEVAEEKAKGEMCAEVIKRQDKEIAQKDAKIERLAEENERLRAHKERLEELRVRDMRFMDIYMEASGAKKVIKDTKHDTVRKMQERLKAKANENEKFPYVGYIHFDDIDEIAKEMLEGEK